MSEILSIVALPEIILAVSAMVLLMYGVFQPAGARSGEIVGWLAVLALAVAGVVIAAQPAAATFLFNDAFIVDPFGRFMKLLVIAGSAFALLLSFDYFKAHRAMVFELPVLILLATVGMMMMVSAGDLVSLYLGLELQSLSLYVVAAIRRDALKSSEAGLKYFVLGALSSGMLLYGASLIYGFTGTTSFQLIAGAAKAASDKASIGLIVGLVFLLVGIAFKISAVPFHMWTPDVYEGAPTPVTAFFAAAPKMAAMALLMRTIGTAFPGLSQQWQQIIIFLAIASMLLGAFAAIGQTNIKRLMAYSSIGHIGFALVGLAANSQDGAQSVLIYMAIYLVMTIGTFACILSMRRKDEMVEDIEELGGLAVTNLPMATALGVLLFSLAGIPPLAGFFAKFYVFAAAIKAELYTLAVVGVLASVVGAYYYLRIVKIMFFDDPRERFLEVPRTAGLIMGLAGLLVLFYAAFPYPLVEAAAVAAKSLRF